MQILPRAETLRRKVTKKERNMQAIYNFIIKKIVLFA